MRVEFTTEGGVAYFPGLSRPAVLDSSELPKSDADELERLLTEANFFEQPAPSRTQPKGGAADYRQYTITVEQEHRHHTIRLADPIEDTCLQSLVEFLRLHATRPTTPANAGAPARRSRTARKHG